ncbi:MAG: hypothetical protein Q8M31_11220 [Beijerinckiaceae bacterium]|nr:hypothetical protein [Beijerinckiaceae bacterium]
MFKLKALTSAAFVATCMTGMFILEAQAQGRPSTLGMSCSQAQSLVRSRGAIVLSTGGHTYDRFVSSRRFCAPDEDEIPTWAPTRDTAQCLVGSRCEPSRSRRFDR